MKIVTIFLMSLFVAPSAFSKCFVNVDLQCAPKPDQQISWEKRTAYLRNVLLNSADVQNNIQNCELYSKLIKTECRISAPLQYVFVADDKKPDEKITGFVISYKDDLYDTRANLPKPFGDYFNASLVAEAVKANAIVPWTVGKDFSVIQIFLKPNSQNTTINLPLACTKGNFFKVCGIQGQCIASKNPVVGDRLELTKIGDSFCSETELNNAVLEKLSAVIASGIATGSDRNVAIVQNKIASFKAFGKMPIVSQVSGNLQGLTYEKYGTNLAVPGLCVPTSQTMMALGLKSISPYSVLGNKFDIPDDIQTQNVRKNIADEKSNAKKKYHENAVHVEEMFRAGGGLVKFPDHYKEYKKFYNNPTVLDGPAIGFKEVAGWKDFASDYDYQKSTQDYVEQNYQKLIGDNKGMVLQLQSTHSQPAQNSTDGLVGHSVTVNGFSGKNMIVADPWNVVSHVKFADYGYPDAGKVIQHLKGSFQILSGASADSIPAGAKIFPDKATCVSTCKSAVADRCESHYSNICTGPGGTVNFAIPGMPGKAPLGADGCVDCGQVVQYQLSQPNTCNCSNGINIIVPKGKRRMLTHVGNQPGYIGTSVGAGSAKTKTAAYVRGYMTAEPFPAMKTADEVRAEDKTTGVIESNPTGQSCTALTQGKIQVNSKGYTFLNPIPKVKKDIAFLSSSTAITAPCTGFKELLSDGSVKTSSVDLMGTFSLTCADGKISVVNNSCGAIVAPKSCTVANASLALAQPTRQYDQPFEYYKGYGSCQVSSCADGFTLRNNKCECEFVNSYNGHLVGEVVDNKCVFTKQSCGPKGVMSPHSTLDHPVCLLTDLNISGYVPGKNEALLSNLKDRKGNSFAKVADINGKYGIDSQGYLIFKGCTSSNYIAKKDPEGFDSCEMKPELLNLLAANPSNGKNADGTCRSGFVKDYENKFCVSTMSSCKYGDEALGLMTFDPNSTERCRFMGCSEGATAIKWSLPDFKKAYWDETGKNQIYSDAEVSGYYCTKNPDQYRAMQNVGIVKVSDNTIIAAPSYSYISNSGYHISTVSCRDNYNVIGVTINSWEKDSTPQNPKIYDSRCLGLSGTIDIKSMPNAISLTKADTILYNCDGSDSMLVSDSRDCLKNWSTKKDSLGQCFIANGKGRYDLTKKRCLVESCHPGFAASFNKYACVDLSRECYYHNSYYFLSQIQDGFNGIPKSTCLSTKTNDLANDYIAGVGMKDWEFKHPNPGQIGYSGYEGFIKYATEDNNGYRSYLTPTINIFKKDPFPMSQLIMGEYLHDKGFYQYADGGKITSWDGTHLKSTKMYYGRESSFSVNLCPRGQIAVKDAFGEHSCASAADSWHPLVDSSPASFVPCEWQLDGTSFLYDGGQTVWAKGYLNKAGCQVTSCSLMDPLYGKSNDPSNNAIFVTSVQAKNQYGQPIANSFNSTCMTAPINEKNIILNNDFTLVRRPDDFFTCDAKTLDGVLLKSGIDCKAKDWYYDNKNYGWIEYMDEDWTNPLDQDPTVTSLAKLKIAIDPKCTATQKLINHQCVAK